MKIKQTNKQTNKQTKNDVPVKPQWMQENWKIVMFLLPFSRNIEKFV